MNDLDSIEDLFDAHFRYEAMHTPFTVFRKDVYPTRRDARRAIAAGMMFVYAMDAAPIKGFVIIGHEQPDDYATIPWPIHAPADRTMVIHLLMVHPEARGQGIASSLLRFVIDMARKQGCTALRLDTGAQNIPAISLYSRHGFTVAAHAPRMVGEAIAHSNHLYLEKPL